MPLFVNNYFSKKIFVNSVNLKNQILRNRMNRIGYQTFNNRLFCSTWDKYISYYGIKQLHRDLLGLSSFSSRSFHSFPIPVGIPKLEMVAKGRTSTNTNFWKNRLSKEICPLNYQRFFRSTTKVYANEIEKETKTIESSIKENTSNKEEKTSEKTKNSKWYEKTYSGADLAWRKQVAWAISLAIIFILIPLFSNILGRKWADDKQKKTLEERERFLEDLYDVKEEDILKQFETRGGPKKEQKIP